MGAAKKLVVKSGHLIHMVDDHSSMVTVQLHEMESIPLYRSRHISSTYIYRTDSFFSKASTGMPWQGRKEYSRSSAGVTKDGRRTSIQNSGTVSAEVPFSRSAANQIFICDLDDYLLGIDVSAHVPDPYSLCRA